MQVYSSLYSFFRNSVFQLSIYFSNKDGSLVKSDFMLVWALAELLQYLWDLSLKDTVCKALASSQIPKQRTPQMALVKHEFSTFWVRKGKKNL